YITKKMKRIYQLTTLTVLIVVLAACGSTEEATTDLASKQAKLDSLKADFAALNAQIKSLESEIAELDPDAKRNQILVTTLIPGKKEFRHNLQLRGSVESKKNVMLSAETMGVVQSVNVTEGQKVAKGALLLTLDASVLSSSIKEVETQLELAKVVYERQEKLWNQKIGTEIQYLQAKNNYQSLVTKKSTLEAQLDQARVRAPFDGTIDLVSVKTGEMVQPGMSLIRLVNPSEMYIKADVSETYLGMFKAGDPVMVEIPGTKQSFKSTVKSVSSVLNMNNRTFQLEVNSPKSSDIQLRPNQVAALTIADYVNPQAVVLPSNIILSGTEGKFVYALANNGTAKKMVIEAGKSAGSSTEIITGLSGSEKIINKGFREVSDGAAVRVAEKVASK
ncbi:MAG: efflux RND transporter periplasmic adaptor subunit, partial [Cyclobacteriaceae bacterium]